MTSSSYTAFPHTHSLYSIKMRASKMGRHISGAERIVTTDQLAHVSTQLMHRALNHPKGTPDDIHITSTHISPADITHIPALPIQNIDTHSPRQAQMFVEKQLAKHGIAGNHFWSLLTTVTGLRGAMLIDADTHEHYEPDQNRGVRVSNLDAAYSATDIRTNMTDNDKNHHNEALILASKVAHHPNIIAELCISDDPDYTTGYLCINGTYLRIHNMKAPGDTCGTRIFLTRNTHDSDIPKLIDYLENHIVLVDFPESA
ncbi:6-carboxyhexanoate--CoA ligase [Corynebacterium sp. sy017]|uniref:6-carboxyhexanoate--CoA ligase n=1 Tax=unclassified Corynebacterium TaxID=2624378 RepID=UPI00118501E8|nr:MULTISPECIES: 6-carboxyhexanoate--CoA ligase [unclassified Corynebacterium]MBP3089065.1 6-carboxyhexanoate--CoA ligase [Corynebacterium sp. sy017]TSD91381.1 6-carboxyhexanoate--CoA ligase [Corynebacterium sp. SY003]